MSKFENQVVCGDWIEVLKTLPDGIFHCCVTSPPYWGQRLYSFGAENPCDGKTVFHDWDVGEILQICRNCGAKAPIFGLEKTPEEHIEKLVEGFREVWRVLRPDGVLWVNYGDKYASTPLGKFSGASDIFNGRDLEGYKQSGVMNTVKASGLQQGNLLMLPARVALALQADGWILRDDVIWAKAISFCSKYSGSTMPESVNGWRWERCRVKTKAEDKNERTPAEELSGFRSHSGYEIKESARYRDCPGCSKCEKNGGLVW